MLISSVGLSLSNGVVYTLGGIECDELLCIDLVAILAVAVIGHLKAIGTERKIAVTILVIVSAETTHIILVCIIRDPGGGVQVRGLHRILLRGGCGFHDSVRPRRA